MNAPDDEGLVGPEGVGELLRVVVGTMGTAVPHGSRGAAGRHGPSKTGSGCAVPQTAALRCRPPREEEAAILSAEHLTASVIDDRRAPLAPLYDSFQEQRSSDKLRR